MKKQVEVQLIECHILMSEALRGYEDRAYVSNKISDIRMYRNKLPKEIYSQIDLFMNENIYPLAYDVDYWFFIEKDGRYGSFDDSNHFIIDSDRSLECIIFRKYHHVQDLLKKLNQFMLEKFELKYDS